MAFIQRRRPHWLTGAHLATWVVLALLCLLDIWAASSRHPAWPVIAFFASAAFSLPRPTQSRIPRGLRLTTPIVISLAITATSTFTNWAAFGPAETGVLIVLFIAVIRVLSSRPAAMAAVLAAAAVLVMPLRETEFLSDPSAKQTLLATQIVLAVLLAGSLVASLYLRSLDTRRHDAVLRTRIAERSEMAAELHDFVAHHVTGILAEARMGQMLLPEDPAAVSLVLHHIETAASDALDSMRQTVHLLRDIEAAPMATVNLAALPGLVSGSGLNARLILGTDVTDDLPLSLQAAAFRVIRESLTNARKHAERSAQVNVSLSIDDHQLVIVVDNDASYPGSRPHSALTGFGLIGLRERVEALGGTLSYGPSDAGWTVTAVLPTRTH